MQIWHLYVSGAINGLFGHIQRLAHSTSMSLIVPERHYTRASAFESLQMSGGYIAAPAIAGSIYAVTGLSGILIVDLITFGVAISSLSIVSIPQPTEQQSHQSASSGTMLQQLTFGARYLFNRPSLKSLLIFVLISRP